MRIFTRDREFYRRVMTIAVPVSCQNLINVGVMMADTVMLGMLSEVHLSAASLANQVGFIFMLFVFGIGSGSNVMVAQYWGKRDVDSIRQVFTMMYRCLIAGAFFFTAIALFFPGYVMRIFSTDSEVIGYGVEYLKLIGYQYILSGFATCTMISLRAMSKVKVSLVVSITSLGTNVFFNWVFIFGNLGVPAMGVAGAAAATIIARIVEVSIIIVYLSFFEKQINYRLRHFFARKIGILKDYLSTAFPVIVNELLWGVGASMISIIIGRMGTAFTAAFSVCNVVGQLVSVAIMGISNAAGVMIGNTVGGGDYGKAKEYARSLMALAVLFGLFASGLVLLLRTPVISFYNITELAKSYAYQIITVHAVVVFMQAIALVSLMGVLRGGGDTRFVLMMDVIFMWVVSIPLGFFTGLYLGLPVLVVYTVIKSDEFLKSIFALARIFQGDWINDITAREGEKQQSQD